MASMVEDPYYLEVVDLFLENHLDLYQMVEVHPCQGPLDLLGLVDQMVEVDH
jgi:hypothetical protein